MAEFGKPNNIERALDWLVEALNLRRPDLPSDLDTGAVAPTIDIYQGGWGIKPRWVPIQLVVAAGSAPGELELSANSHGSHSVVCALDVLHLAGAGARDLEIILAPLVGTFRVRLAHVVQAINTRSYTRDWFGGLNDWVFVPPEFRLTFNHPGTAAGETYEINYLLTTFPVGTSPRS